MDENENKNVNPEDEVQDVEIEILEPAKEISPEPAKEVSPEPDSVSETESASHTDAPPVFETPAEPEKPKKKKKKGTFFKVIAVLLICALLGTAVAIGAETVYSRYTRGGFRAVFDPSLIPEVPEETEEPEESSKPESTPAPSTPTPAPTATPKPDKGRKSTGETLTPAELYEQNVDATVSITTSVSGYNAWGQTVDGAAAGSGFIIDERGYILTNYHVIEDAKAVTVNTYDGEEYDAKIVGYDETNDVAVLKIEGKDDFNTVIIGDSDSCKVGEEVVAIGNSLGEFEFSMTRGIISGIKRDVRVSSSQTMSLIQTDCTINAGNSGGALFNMRGEVIGITNAKYSSNGSYDEPSIENVGFAIPINSVSKIVNSIVEGKGMTRPYIGVTVSDVSEEVANATGVKKGAYIVEVTPGSPAEKAGLKPGAIVIQADSAKIEGYSQLGEFVQKCEPGDEVTLKIYYQGKTLDIKVIIGETEDTNIVFGGNDNDDSDSVEDQEKPYPYGGYDGNDDYDGDYEDPYNPYNPYYPYN